MKPICGDCNITGHEIQLIVTLFPDGIARLLCPRCRRKMFVQTTNGEVVKGYRE